MRNAFCTERARDGYEPAALCGTCTLYLDEFLERWQKAIGSVLIEDVLLMQNGAIWSAIWLHGLCEDSYDE